jgi:uncharacterized protein YgiM (DUF1202 family)
MLRRGRFLAVTAVLAAGVLAAVLIPGRTPPTTAAVGGTAQVAIASASSPNPDLLRRIDAALAPPTVEAQPQDDGEDVASVQPVSLTTGANIATPAVVKTPDPTLQSDTIGSSAVNLRSGPSSSSPQLSVLQPGEAVQTGQTSGGWIEVTRADGTTGWIYGSYLSSNAAIRAKRATQAPTVASNQPRAVIKGDDGDLEDRTARIASRLPAYDQPGGSDPVMTFSPGTRVRIAEVRGNWLRVETGEGTSAWIRR